MPKDEFVLTDGTVLTPELEERLAQEAKAGYDLSRAKRVVLETRPGLRTHLRRYVNATRNSEG